MLTVGWNFPPGTRNLLNMPRDISLPLILLVTASLCACGDEAPPPAAEAPVTPAPPPAEPEPEPEPPAPPEPEPPVFAIDTHADTTQRMLDDDDDIAERLPDGHLDLPRMREGGLSAVFLSIWVSPMRFRGDRAWTRANQLIAAVERFVRAHPDEVTLCRSADEVQAAFEAGKIGILMGVEGGHALGTRSQPLALRRLRDLYRRGVRYMTITWSTDNPLAASSTGDAPERGLTSVGRAVVREMNRLGMIVDVSHVSDQTFTDIMEVTSKPVFASHSSCRALADHPRNMTDAMIRRVADQGGAVCVNFYSQFIDADYRARRRRVERRNRDRFAALATEHASWRGRAAAAYSLARELDPELNPPNLEVLGAHFAHIVEVAGPEAACLGSDFDGVPELPEGLSDVSELGNLRAELERRELPIRPIFGGNVLRVLAAQDTTDARD